MAAGLASSARMSSSIERGGVVGLYLLTGVPLRLTRNLVKFHFTLLCWSKGTGNPLYEKPRTRLLQIIEQCVCRAAIDLQRSSVTPLHRSFPSLGTWHHTFLSRNEECLPKNQAPDEQTGCKEMQSPQIPAICASRTVLAAPCTAEWVHKQKRCSRSAVLSPWTEKTPQKRPLDLWIQIDKSFFSFLRLSTNTFENSFHKN